MAKRDAFEEARSQSFGDGERFSMPEYKSSATQAQPVKREHVETVNKSTGANAAPAPKSPNEDRSVEVKPLPPMKPKASAKPKNFSSPPPTPKPRPEPEAKVTLGKPVFMQTDGSFVSAAKPQRSKIGQAISDATDFAVENILPIAPAARVAGGAAKAIGSAATKALPPPTKALPAPKPPRLQDSTSGPTINLGGPAKKPKPKSERLDAGVRRTVNRGKKKK